VRRPTLSLGPSLLAELASSGPDAQARRLGRSQPAVLGSRLTLLVPSQTARRTRARRSPLRVRGRPVMSETGEASTRQADHRCSPPRAVAPSSTGSDRYGWPQVRARLWSRSC
jgi:hypothetical protein